MKRIFSSLVLILGIALVLGSMALVAVSFLRKADSSKDMPQTASLLYSLMPTVHDGFIDERTDKSMSSVELDGKDYVGVINVPNYNSTCPVSYNDSFSRTPALISGSIYSQDIIIGATDYQMSFSKLISVGDELSFTDMTGAEFTYTVDSISLEKDFSPEKVSEKDFDLVLFIQASYKNEYTVIFCRI